MNQDESLRAEIYRKLIEVAQAGKLITYSELAGSAGLTVGDKGQMKQLSKALEQIALAEVAGGKPLLMVVVIREDTNMPGGGLFKFAKDHGLMGKMDELTFFTTELQKVYQIWKNPLDRDSPSQPQA
jgi:hypothetical protein